MPASEWTHSVIEHKRQVGLLLSEVIQELTKRAVVHDNSKFSQTEYDAYAEILPKFKMSPYGSDEYKECCKAIAPAIEHHVTTNRHHPEYHWGGISGMTLIDLIEMVCDWIAASWREGSDTPTEQGLQINKERFHIDDQLYSILKRTVDELVYE